MSPLIWPFLQFNLFCTWGNYLIIHISDSCSALRSIWPTTCRCEERFLGIEARLSFDFSYFIFSFLLHFLQLLLLIVILLDGLLGGSRLSHLGRAVALLTFARDELRWG